MFMGTLIKHRKMKNVEMAWRDLYQRNGALTPFQSYDYCSTVGRLFLFSTKHIMRNVIYEFKDGEGQTVLIMPLHLRTVGDRTLAYLWGEFSQASYLGCIHSRELSSADFQEAFLKIAQDLGKVTFLFTRVQEKSRLSGLLESAESPWRYSREPNPCVHIPILDNYDQYLASLSRNAQQKLRSCHNRIREAKVKFEVRTRVDQPLPFPLLKRLFDVYWDRLAEKKINLKLRKFLPYFVRMWCNPAIIALTHSPDTFSSIVYIDDQIAGFCAGFTSQDGHVILPFVAMNSKFSRFSPGGLMISEAIRELIQIKKHRYFDLSRGDEQYKTYYGGELHTNFDYEISLDA
jgi:CelD/BcsL family acetyltransferase involved in cellulose biosynthesis